LETLPLSTIIESTTMSEPRGSTPTWVSSMDPRDLFSSTALMLLEPISSPTSVLFPPMPNIVGTFRLNRGSGARRFGLLLLPVAVGLGGALLLHPGIKQRFLEAPAIPKLEGGDALFGNVLVKRVRRDAQVLRRLPDVHNLSGIGHEPDLSAICFSWQLGARLHRSAYHFH